MAAGELPVIAGVLLTVDGVLIDGLLMTGADGTIGAAGVLPRADGVLPTGAGVLIEGVPPVIAGAPPVVRGVVPDTDGVVPTGEGVLPLTDGAAPETPLAGVPLVCAKAGVASMTATAMREVRVYMRKASLT